MFRRIMIAAGALALASGVAFATPSPDKIKICDKEEQKTLLRFIPKDCPSPSPSPTVTPTPSATPVPTPLVVPAPNVEVNVSGGTRNTTTTTPSTTRTVTLPDVGGSGR